VLELHGITWDHPRGLAPMRATAAAFEQAQGDIHIRWDARSLQAFGDQPIEQLAAAYDLLVIDHPLIAAAARGGWLVALDERLPASFLAAQAAQSVGSSYASYTYDGHQWALPIDAAAQVSAYRLDLLDALGEDLPRTWGEVLALARRADTARVAIPLNPINAVCSFLTLCASYGDPPGSDAGRLVGRTVGRTALDTLRRLVAHAHPESLSFDPPRMLDRMATTDDIVYCPLVFGYATYARPDAARRPCRFGDIPSPTGGGVPRGGLLGGAGLAISSSCRSIDQACAYAQWVASAECQRTLYVASGGQPGNRLAWTDPGVNAAAGDFFLDTLDTLDHAYLRPRHAGFAHVQDRAGLILRDYLRHGGVSALSWIRSTPCTPRAQRRRARRDRSAHGFAPWNDGSSRTRARTAPSTSCWPALPVTS